MNNKWLKILPALGLALGLVLSQGLFAFAGTLPAGTMPLYETSSVETQTEQQSEEETSTQQDTSPSQAESEAEDTADTGTTQATTAEEETTEAATSQAASSSEPDSTSDISSSEIEEEETDSSIQLQPAMDVVDTSTVVVYTYAELSTALSEDNGYTYIYLGNDITQTSSDAGITINAAKASVVIDGFAPDAAAVATFTQRTSLDITYTIKVVSGNATTKQVTLRNLNLVGQNYYGIVSVADAVSGVALVYENITYTGNQITYNANGSARYVDSTINIIYTNGVAHEVAEAASVSFGGTVAISSATTGNSLFWLRGTSTSMSFDAGANVTATTSLYFIYADGSYPTVTLNAGASLTYTGGTQGFVYDAQRLGNLYINSGASLSITQNKAAYAYGTLRINTLLQMESGSNLYINRAASGAAIQFPVAGGSAIFNNPERVMLYAPSSALFYYASTGSLSITTDAVNIWQTSSGYTSDSISNTPTYMWNRTGGQALTIASTFSGATQTALTTNLDANDPTANLTTSTFTPRAAQMLVFGRFNLDINAVTNASIAISGTTETNAEVQISYPAESGQQTVTGAASGTSYAVGISELPVLDGSVTVLAHSNWLNKVETITVVDADDYVLRFVHVPDILVFDGGTVPETETIIERADNDSWYIEIEDTRINASGWALTASIASPMTATVDGGSYYLTNGLIFVDSDGITTSLTVGGQVVIHSSTQAAAGNVQLTWTSAEGVLLQVNPGEVVSGVTYSTTIQWVLQDAP